MTLVYDKINEFGRRELCWVVESPNLPIVKERKFKQTKLSLSSKNTVSTEQSSKLPSGNRSE